MQVLLTQRPFSFEMPVMSLDSLEAGKNTELSDCVPLSLGEIKSAALTVECTYAEEAKLSLSVSVYTSTNGLDYDSKPLLLF